MDHEGENNMYAGRSRCSRQDFQTHLKEKFSAAQQGQRGLEAAFELVCDRVMSLEDDWERLEKVRSVLEIKRVY